MEVLWLFSFELVDQVVSVADSATVVVWSLSLFLVLLQVQMAKKNTRLFGRLD